MATKTWGNAGQVGEWGGLLTVPIEHQQPPIAATCYVLEQLRPMLASLHRPHQLLLSWGEYASDGTEIAFHELEEHVVDNWDAIIRILQSLTQRTATPAVSALFIGLDTLVIDADDRPAWERRSAEIQVSVPQPETMPEIITVDYRTFIDIWLSVTYGDGYQPRKNHAVDVNRPALTKLLTALRALIGSSFQVGQSRLYYTAITETGFRDTDTLPKVQSTARNNE